MDARIEPRYLLQIVHADDPSKVFRLPAGGQLERDLVELIVDAIVAESQDALDALIERAVRLIVAKGVGVFRTEAHVADAVRTGLDEALERQRDTRRLAIASGVRAALLRLKMETA